MIEPYEKLAQAIVIQAVKDYRKAAHKLKYHPNSKSAAIELADCKRFFLSEWFEELTSLDGEMVIKKLEEEVC